MPPRPQSPLLRSRPDFRVLAVILLLGRALLSPLPAARLSYQPTAPVPGANDVANLVGATRDRNNIGGNGSTDGSGNDAATYVSGSDRPHQGQTFTTGTHSAGYRVNAVWLRHAGYTANTTATWWSTPAGAAFTVRVTAPAAAGTAAFVLATETAVTTGVESGAPNAFAPVAAVTSADNGTGVWLRFAFASPVVVSPNTRYGFDVAATSAGLFFETLGVRDAATGGNPYAAGSAYNGSTAGAADNTLNALAGDRVFLVELAPADGADPELAPPHAAPVTTVAPFPLERVRLLPSRFKSNQELHRTGYLAWISPDRLLYPFRANAGLPQPTGVSHLGGWEGDSGFTAVRGHMAGHYLTAASKMYAATGDASYLPKIATLVAELKKCQDALGAQEIAAGRVAGYLSGSPSSDFTTLETNPAGAPVPFYTIHKILAGLVDAYRHCGNAQALDVAIAMADYHRWRIARLTAAQIEAMFRTDNGNTEEWGGMNETLADLYRFSLARGDSHPARHLEFARLFHRDWFITPLVANQDQLAGLHANTHVPQVVGFARVASFLPETDPERARLYTAATNFWTLVHDRHWLVLGGNSYAEHFAAPDVETGLNGAALGVSTAETCNTHNMLKLTAELFAHAPSVAYADYHEHALYNHILASLAPSATNLAAWVRPTAGPLTYLADSALPGATTRGEVLLRPFYDVHHTRYATYWKLVAPSAFSTWSGGAGAQTGWNTAANWDAPPAAGSALRFASATGGPSTNNLAAGTLLHGLAFPGGAGPFVLGGNRIALAGDLLNASAAGQRIDLPLELRDGLPWSFDAATADLTLGGALTGAGTLVKHGPHTLMLLADATFSGGLHVAAGDVCIGDGGATGDLGLIPVTLAAADTVLVFDRADTFDVRAPVSGAGTLVKHGPGTLRLLSAVTHVGETRVDAGALRIASEAVPVLAHRWSFNGDLADSVGAATATLVEIGANNATLSATELSLAGGDKTASDYVSLGAGLLPKDGRPVTLEFWATQVTRQNWGRIFDIGASASENLFMCWSRESLATDRVEWKDVATATTDDTCAPLALGTEYHIALVIEPGAGGQTRVTWYAAPASSATLGAARGSFETSNTLADIDDAVFWLGRSQYGDPTASARYNEVRLWTRAFSAAELEQLHDLGSDSTGAFATRTVTGCLSPSATLRIAAGAVLDLGSTAQEVATLSGEAGCVVRLGSGGRLVIRGGGDPAATFSGTITGTGEIRNEGALRLTGAAGLPAGVTLTNRGLLDTMTWSGSLPAGFVNQGVVLDRDAVKVDAVAQAAGVFTLTIQGRAGHVYRLQYRDDLVAGEWTDLGDPRPGLDAPIIFSDTRIPAGAARHFYRVAVE